MANEHPFLEDIPAYAIGALDPADASVLEAHLKTCEICQAKLADYKTLNEKLLLATQPQRPPERLRRRLQGRLPGAQKPVRPRLAWSFNQVAVGFTVVLLLALNIFSIFQIQSMQRRQEQLTRQLQTSQTVLAALAYPETRSLPINADNITGRLLLDEEQNLAVLLAWNLPVLQAGQTYQVWLIDPQGKRTSGGIFNSQPDLAFTSVSVFSPDSLSNFIGIGVTVEPAGGSSQPTGQKVFRVDF